MRFYVAITDHEWFEQLSSSGPHDEVNFWQPSGTREFSRLQPGEPLLFKLHAPRNFIVGGGFFRHSTIMPASLVWKAFESRNGARTEPEMRARIARYRREVQSATVDYDVGCILLLSPFFLPESHWIPLPKWSKPIVQGKTYDTDEMEGRNLWSRVHTAMSSASAIALPEIEEVVIQSPRGSPQIVFPRLGQGSFRLMVTDAYERRCAFTRSPVLHVLHAGHIKPFSEDGPHAVDNGLLMRQDLHTLFDKGYITVTPAHKIEVSRRIHEEFDNGKEYYSLHGEGIALPQSQTSWPSPNHLTWHNEHCYRG